MESSSEYDLLFNKASFIPYSIFSGSSFLWIFSLFFLKSSSKKIGSLFSINFLVSFSSFNSSKVLINLSLTISLSNSPSESSDSSWDSSSSFSSSSSLFFIFTPYLFLSFSSFFLFSLC